MAFDEILTSQYRLINQVIAFTVRRYRLNAGDADDFTSLVHLKLVENDYEVFRKFRQEAKLRTYLTVVIQRLCLDFRTAQWGKFRPSAEARRQGRVAILLERLTIRDGYSFDEACALLRTNHGMAIGDAELERLRTLLPVRTPRRQVDDSELETMPATDVDAESAAMLSEGRPVAARLWETLDRLLADLPAADRVLLEMRFEQGLTVAQISRMRQCDQAWLYRHLQELFGALRTRLQEEGFAASEIDMYLASPSTPVAVHQVPMTARKAGHGPSL